MPCMLNTLRHLARLILALAAFALGILAIVLLIDVAAAPVDWYGSAVIDVGSLHDQAFAVISAGAAVAASYLINVVISASDTGE